MIQNTEQDRLNILDSVINEDDSFSSIINYSLLTTKATQSEIRTPGFLRQNIVRHELPKKFRDNTAYSIILQFSRDESIEKNFDTDISVAKRDMRKYGKAFPLPPTSNATIDDWEAFFKNDWDFNIVSFLVRGPHSLLLIFTCLVWLVILWCFPVTREKKYYFCGMVGAAYLIIYALSWLVTSFFVENMWSHFWHGQKADFVTSNKSVYRGYLLTCDDIEKCTERCARWWDRKDETSSLQETHELGAHDNFTSPV